MIRNSETVVYTGSHVWDFQVHFLIHFQSSFFDTFSKQISYYESSTSMTDY